MVEKNKDTAIRFLQMATSGEVREAYDRFVGPGFKHHNPFFEGAVETLMAGMEENARQNPNKVLDVKHGIAEGEFVAALWFTSSDLKMVALSSCGMWDSLYRSSHPISMGCSR